MNEFIINRETPNLNQTNSDYNQPRYMMNDLCSVYTHYDTKLGINVSTPNILPVKEDNKNGQTSQ